MNLVERKIPYLEKAKSLSNKDLFEEIFEMANGDDGEGQFTTESLAEFFAYKHVLEERLALWMEE